MKAIRIHDYGPSDQIRYEDIGRPIPAENQVLVHVKDVGVNPIDWKIREGQMKDWLPVRFPYTLGQDFAGQVVEVGVGVTGFKIGDNVYGFAHGSYAEFAVVDESNLARMPEHIDYLVAAAIPTAGLTAYQLIMNCIELKKGQALLIHGAGGGVGSFAVQLALWKGAEVFATASKADFEYLKGLGLKNMIDYQTERFDEIVHDLDAVIDLVGGETLTRSFNVVKKGGILASTVGPLDQILAEQKDIHAKQFAMKRNSEDLVETAKLVERGVLLPRINEILPLSEAKRAHDELQGGHAKGKIVLQV